MVGIYRIVNKRNGKCYYGSSANVEKRFSLHLKTLRNGTHHNTHLQRAWIQYGEDAFVFEMVEECSTDQLLMVEQTYLDSNAGGYNIGKKSSGGDNITAHPDRDLIVSKIKEANQQRMSNMTEEERQERFSKPMQSNPNWKGGISNSTCEVCDKKISQGATRCMEHIKYQRSGVNNPFHGKTHSEETKAKMRDIAKNRTTKPSNSKKVMAEGVLYQTGQEVAKAFGITRALVNYRCKSDKYDWMFVN